MKLPISFRAIARDEYNLAITWYEGARSGLGSDFETEVEAGLHEIAAKPDRYPIADRDVCEAPMRGFPYCVYYRVRSNMLIVVAVFHQSRDPDELQTRM